MTPHCTGVPKRDLFGSLVRSAMEMEVQPGMSLTDEEVQFNFRDDRECYLVSLLSLDKSLFS